MGVSKLNLENMNEDLVKRFNTLDLYTKSGLNTETTTALVDALNEIIGKNIISKSVGAPLENTDLWKDMGTKIDTIVNDLRNNLSNKGINVKGKVLSELVKLVVNIPEDTSEIDRNIVKLISEALGRPITEDDSVVEVCENIDGMTKDFRDKLSSKGVNVEETDRMMDLVTKVDDVGRGGEIIPESWETKANMTTARYYLTSSAVNNKIYCIGGYIDKSSLSNKNECYDTINNTWESKSTMLTGRYGLTAESIDNNIYCIGGYFNMDWNKNECYDVNTNTWSTKANMLTARSYLGSVINNNEIYCIGGNNNNIGDLSTVECYDINTNTWSTKKSLPSKRIHLTSSAVNNKIYCIGGYNGSYLNKNECYDINIDIWTTKSEMPTARMQLTSNAIDGKIYCIGGSIPSSTNKVEVYDTDSDTWDVCTSMPTSRYRVTSENVNGKIYIIGGYNGTTQFNKNECYIPESKQPNILVQALGNTLGINTDIDDSVYDVCDIIDELTVDFRNKLSEKGIEVSEDEKIFDLINKLNLI